MAQLVFLFIYLVSSVCTGSSNKVSLSMNEFECTIHISNTNNPQINCKTQSKNESPLPR